MANKTTNYGLTKPLESEFYDVNVQNGNMDIIDTQIKALDSKSATAKTTLVDADTIPLNDSAASNALKKITWANIKTVLGNVFAPKSHTHTKSQISDFPSSIAPSAHASSHKTGGSDAISPSDIGAVPTSRTVNGKALSANISLTATDVGLGNVPNVATNNQTPTYSQASTLANIASGEKLSVSMGKIMKAIADFITHKGSTSNPHNVTASQVGAVPTSRTVNGKALSSNITLSASDVSAVPTTRTVNGKALSSNISLTASDVGAASSGHSHTAADVGAVAKNEDIVIQKSGAAYDSIFGQGTRNALMRVRNVAGNATNQRTLALFDSTQRTDIETCLRLYDVTGGTETIYSIFGEHNLDKLATSLGAAKIQTGSYTGANKGSANYPNTLTFNFTPKVVIISATNAAYYGILTYGNIRPIMFYSSGNTAASVNGGYMVATWSGNSVSWYNTASADMQLNSSSKNYIWVAIG